VLLFERIKKRLVFFVEFKTNDLISIIFINQFIKLLMKYLIAKLITASFVVFEAASQSTLDPTNPTWGWSDYK